jgi:hypothetical protein
MKPYYYSDFLSTYVKVFFTDKNYPLDKTFLEELFIYIKLNSESCFNHYGEFLESTIHINVIVQYLKSYFYSEKNEIDKYAFLVEYENSKNFKNLSANLLDEKVYAFRLMKHFYETFTLN